MRRGLSGGGRCLEECHERRGLRRTQILSASRHVTATLNLLANELILGERQGDAVEFRPSTLEDTELPISVRDVATSLRRA